jgi:hypothetical protein
LHDKGLDKAPFDAIVHSPACWSCVPGSPRPTRKSRARDCSNTSWPSRPPPSDLHWLPRDEVCWGESLWAVNSWPGLPGFRKPGS